MLPKSKRFALERKEEANETIWLTFETTVLREVLKCVSISTDEKSTHKVYSDLVYYSAAPFSTYFLPQDVVF